MVSHFFPSEVARHRGASEAQVWPPKKPSHSAFSPQFDSRPNRELSNIVKKLKQWCEEGIRDSRIPRHCGPRSLLSLPSFSLLTAHPCPNRVLGPGMGAVGRQVRCLVLDELRRRVGFQAGVWRITPNSERPFPNRRQNLEQNPFQINIPNPIHILRH